MRKLIKWCKEYWPLPVIIPLMWLMLSALAWSFYENRSPQTCVVIQKKVLVYVVEGVEFTWGKTYWETPEVVCHHTEEKGK